MADILIVDDNIFARNLERTLLDREGFDVTEVCSGEEALEILRHKRFDVVIVDHHLPGMSGLEMMRRLRLTDRETSVLYITAGIPDAADLFDQGASAVLKKPYGLHDLRAGVEQCLEERFLADY